MTFQAISSFVRVPSNWGIDWVWSLPLIVLTVVIHVLGLGLIQQKAASTFDHTVQQRHHVRSFVMILGGTTLLATVLHGIEAGLWSVAYLVLHAIPDAKSAMLYSLNAITSYGHTNLDLEDRWHLMGALEALNGWLLFGLTTAFLFAVIEQSGFVTRRRQ